MRRTVLLLCAAVPLLLAPPAVAAEKKAERESICRVPDVELSYDTETFTTLVTLPVSGCKAGSTPSSSSRPRSRASTMTAAET